MGQAATQHVVRHRPTGGSQEGMRKRGRGMTRAALPTCGVARRLGEVHLQLAAGRLQRGPHLSLVDGRPPGRRAAQAAQ
jgi:hypothetical protein